MLKRLSISSFTFCLFLLIVLLFENTVYAADIFDKTSLSNGVININYKVKQNTKTKVLISKGSNRYFYTLFNQNESFPLQFGNGKYSVTVLENTSGNKYVAVAKDTFAFNLDEKNSAFLNSNQIINWNKDMEAIKLANELTKNAKNDEEKITLIYDYIINNIEYDDEKINIINSSYIPNIDDTLISSKGICYDYSVLFASMLRSVDIPTKLVKGYKNDIYSYHAWNQVYLKDAQKWITIDTTYDATLLKNNVQTSLVKNEEEYTIKKIY